MPFNSLSWGAVLADLDNDGDLDLLYTSLDERPTLLHNESSVGNWLTVVCEQPAGIRH